MACRCVVVDDHPAIVQALLSFLSAQDDIEVVGHAVDGEQGLVLITELEPDVAVLDVRMPGIDGLDVVRRVVAAGLPTSVLLFTGYADRPLVLDALDAGARGFLAKDSPLETVARGVRTVAQGGTFVDPVLAGLVAGAPAAERLRALSGREREVLRLLAEGLRSEQVATTLSISASTVRTHLKHAMQKLEADTRTQAVARALRDSHIV